MSIKLVKNLFALVSVILFSVGTSRTGELTELFKKLPGSPQPETLLIEQADKTLRSGPSTNPFALVCQELESYYSYFANHLMSDQAHLKNKHRLELICNILHLASEVADAMEAPKRSEILAESITALTKVLAISEEENKFVRNAMQKNRYLSELIALQNDKLSRDSELEVGSYIRSLLRTDETGKILLHELFKELAAYAKSGISDLVQDFHGQTRCLLANQERLQNSARLHKNNHSSIEREERKTHEKHDYMHTSEGREFRQQSLVMSAAAHACQEIMFALPAEGPLRNMSPLLSLSHAFFSALSFTYEHRSFSQQTLKRGDCHVMAGHFVHMLETFDSIKQSLQKRTHPEQKQTLSQVLDIDPDRRTHEDDLFFINRCLSLENEEKREAFVQDIFENELDTRSFFNEFFPQFHQCLESSIKQVSKTLESYTQEAFEKTAWQIPLETGEHINIVYNPS